MVVPTDVLIAGLSGSLQLVFWGAVLAALAALAVAWPMSEVNLGSGHGDKRSSK